MGADMLWKRAIVAGLALGALVAADVATAQADARERRETRVREKSAGGASSFVRATALAGPVRTYDKVADAILAADLNALMVNARSGKEDALSDPAVATIAVLDEVAAGRPAGARMLIEKTPARYQDSIRELAAPWIALAEGDREAAINRARGSSKGLPARVGAVLPALLQEATGDLAGASESYRAIIAKMDLTPPPEGEPSTQEEALRALAAPQTTQILYRAALVSHRLGAKTEAQRYYDLVEKFSPGSPDTSLNAARLARDEQPFEPRLDAVRGLGRWTLFLSEEFGRTDALAQILTDPTKDGLTSPSSALFSQFGIALDPSAHDWTLGAAHNLLGADGLDGATRLAKRIGDTSVYAPEGLLVLAEIALRRKADDEASTLSQRALRMAPQRFQVGHASAAVLTRAGRDRDAITAFNAALAAAPTNKDKAEILAGRAAAHHFNGRLDEAYTDAKAAIASDPSEEVRLGVVGYLKDVPQGWAEAVRIGRELLALQPDSSSRLNQLGYTLIFRPEGLEEGFRLLYRGVELNPNDYAVIDSLGWAYYYFGNFEEALNLIERAIDLSPEPVAEILDHHGDVLWRLGQKDQAREAWRKASEARPEVMRRRDLEAKLANGMTTPAPVKRTTPLITPYRPGERSDT
jgi:tetratricopeptide (TPR) repeat protein